jgi:glyoxylase-like metal-dependent hydrolase (beta-lactamase superfamily II)
MQRMRAGLMAGFGVLAGMAVFVTRSDAVPETVKIIAPGVWFREGDIQNLGHCNNIIIEMKDYLIVVDANFPSGARAAMADARRISPKPVKYVFDTHHHGDHLYGNLVWTEKGATTLAFAGVAEELKRLEPGRWQEAAKSRADVKELKQDGPQAPTQDIKENLFVLNDGTRKVEFHHFGWAHTKGDGFVYLPKEQVLCSGDAAVNGPYNYLADANLSEWPAVLAAAGKLKVKTVLPGHGEPAGKELLTGQAEYMTELRKAVKAGVDAGKKPAEIQASIKLPDTVANWVSEASLKGQIRDAYEQLAKR